MNFEFATSGTVFFGEGRARESGSAARYMGTHALVVTGSSSDRHRNVLDSIRAAGLVVEIFRIAGEPDIESAQQGVELARSAHCDLVIALGGGSAIDAGKAIAVLLTNGGTVTDYLEVIGPGRPIERPSAPLMAIPTTAGTGSEVTRNAVLASPEAGVKASLRSTFLLPRLAIIDPELTYDLPPLVTACTGMDALTQVIEPFLSNRANPMTDALCLEGMRRAGRSLRKAFLNGRDAAARADMALASMMGGMALANAGLGVVHGFAASVGGMFKAPHGAVCAALLAPGMDANIRALRERASNSEVLLRFQMVAAALTGNPSAKIEDGPAFIRELCAAFSIPPLSDYGIGSADIKLIVDRASKSSSMRGNPIPLSHVELIEVISSGISPHCP